MINQLVDSAVGFPERSPDVQETSFSLDGVARFVCNTYEEAERAQAEGGRGFDVVVVGSGMYGAYCAAKIFERSLRLLPTERRPRVLVLESGSFLISEHVQNLTRLGSFFNLVNQPLVDENQSFLTQINRGGALEGFSPHHRCVGGKSLFWGGWAPPLGNEDDQDDLARWPGDVREFLLSAEGYDKVAKQIGTDEVADYLKGSFLTELRQRAGDIVRNGEVANLTAVKEAPIAVQANAPLSGLFSMDKFSSLPLLLDSIRKDGEMANGQNGARKLFLVPKAEVLRMETSEGVVRELLIRLREPSRDSRNPMPAGRLVRLSLKEGASVVLAGNTVQSTRLALNSVPLPPQLGREKMGRNLMAHVRGNYFWRIRKSALKLPESVKDFDTSALHIEGRLTLPGGRPARFHFQFYAVGSLKEDPEEFLYRLIPNIEDIEDVKKSTSATDLDQWIVVGIRTCGEMIGDAGVEASAGDSSFVSVNPFGGSGDDVFVENGAERRIPKAYVRLVQSDDDAIVRAAQTQAAFEFVAKLAGVSESEARSTTGQKIQFIRGGEDGMGTTYHEGGTLWMGNDPETSVTDVNGHLHHVSNVQCVDQSIFPTVGSANPVPTGLALSDRIAGNLVARFGALPIIQQRPAGFVPLFDGTLAGWRKFGEGSIVPLSGLGILEAGTPGVDSALGFLRTDAVFQNFELQLEWKAFSIRANSGIFLRMPEFEGGDLNRLYAASIEIQIDETGKWFVAGRDPAAVYGSSLHKTGAVYGLAPARQWAAKAVSDRGQEGNWNLFRIRVEGSRISVKLNDKTVIEDFTLPPHLVGPGHVALQCHTEVVQFRNVLIQPLS